MPCRSGFGNCACYIGPVFPDWPFDNPAWRFPQHGFGGFEITWQIRNRSWSIPNVLGPDFPNYEGTVTVWKPGSLVYPFATAEQLANLTAPDSPHRALTYTVDDYAGPFPNSEDNKNAGGVPLVGYVAPDPLAKIGAETFQLPAIVWIKHPDGTTGTGRITTGMIGRVRVQAIFSPAIPQGSHWHLECPIDYPFGEQGLRTDPLFMNRSISAEYNSVVLSDAVPIQGGGFDVGPIFLLPKLFTGILYVGGEALPDTDIVLRVTWDGPVGAFLT